MIARRRGPRGSRANRALVETLRHPSHHLPEADRLAGMPDMTTLPPHPAPLPEAPPEALGLDPDRIAEAVRFALAHESPWPRDIRAHIEAGFFEPPPDNAVLGPVRPRGGPNGLI